MLQDVPCIEATRLIKIGIERCVGATYECFGRQSGFVRLPYRSENCLGRRERNGAEFMRQNSDGLCLGTPDIFGRRRCANSTTKRDQ